MSSATSATWASVAIASIATAANIWSAYDSHIAKRESVIAKETLVAAQAKVISLQNKADAQDVVLSNALERVSLYGNIIAAEGGDRWAYKRAREMLLDRSKGDGVSEPMIQMLNYTMQRFHDEATNNSFIAHNAINLPPPLYDGANVLANLRSPDIYKRFNALGAILTLRLNKYIPDAVDIAKEEPNLNVLQLLIYVIGETFTDNLIMNDTTPVYSLTLDDCVFRYDEFKRHFTEMWNPAKTRILARKHKEVRERPDPPRGNLVYIYDPEMPDSNK